MSEVLKKLIGSKRLPVLFIGSGVSKRYLENYPSWEELLNKLREQIGITSTSFNAKKQSIISENYNITSGKLNQLIASFLQKRFLEKIENDEIDLTKLFTKEELDLCEIKNVDYFKLLVAKNLAKYKVLPQKEEELKLLKKISEKISMVFTTNYDEFLEKEIFSDFKVYESQNKYYFRTNNGYGELYKIHGSVIDPNGIIICEQDYKKFDNSLKLVSSKLINALLDFPIIFLGYSLEDENIKKIMTDFINSFEFDILQEIKHYMVMVIYEKGQKELIEGEKQFADEGTGKAITLKTIKTDNFKTIYEYIDRLTPTATAYELRKYKSMVSKIITRASKGEKAIYVQDLDKAEPDTVALYIGERSTVERFDKSVNIYSNEDIIRLALENSDFNYNILATQWYDSKSIRSTEYTPVFFIRSKIVIPFEECCEKFKSNYNCRKKYFEKDFNIKNMNISNYDELKNSISTTLNKKTSEANKYNLLCDLAMSAIYNKKITLSQYEEFLIGLLKKYPLILKGSNFKKAVCYLWFLKFEK